MTLKEEIDALPMALQKWVKSARSSLSVSAGIANTTWAKPLHPDRPDPLHRIANFANLLDPKKWIVAVRELSNLAVHTNDEACFNALNILVKDLKAREGWLGEWGRQVGLKRLAKEIPQVLMNDANKAYSENHIPYAWEAERREILVVRFLDDTKKLIMNCSISQDEEGKLLDWQRAFLRSPWREDGINYTNSQDQLWWSRFAVAEKRSGEVGRAWLANELSAIPSGKKVWGRADPFGGSSEEFASPWKMVHRFDSSLRNGYQKKEWEANQWVNACVRAYTSRARTEDTTARAISDFVNVFALDLSAKQRMAFAEQVLPIFLVAFQKHVLSHNITFRNEWATKGLDAALSHSLTAKEKAWWDVFLQVGKAMPSEEWVNEWAPFDKEVVDLAIHGKGTSLNGVVWPSAANSNLDLKNLEQALRGFKLRLCHERDYALLKERAGATLSTARVAPAL
jgi:hypothetical protein